MLNPVKMATAKHIPSASDRRPDTPRSNSDSLRWVSGILLLFLGLFAALAVFFSYFCWAADQSGLQKEAADRLTLGIEPENLCGWTGARIGLLLVDRSFGLFGILIPVMLALLGLRIIRQRPLLLNQSALSCCFVTILGSLTFGFLFGRNVLLGSSTGMGGAFGVQTAELLHLHIGSVGTIILLLGGWILTGVFINRNFINTVNSAGNAMADRSGRLVDLVRQKVAHVPAPDGEEPEEAPVLPARPSVQKPPLRTPAPAPAPEPEPETAAPAPAAESPAVDPEDIVRPADPLPWREEPVEEVPDFGEEREAPAEKPLPEERGADGDDGNDGDNGDNAPDEEANPFVEEPIAGDASARVVMGPGGLVELDRPVVPRVPWHTPRSQASAADNPFVEYPLEQPETAAPAAPHEPVEPIAPAEPADPDTPAAPAAPAVEIEVERADPAEEPLLPDTPDTPDPEAALPAEGTVVTVEQNEALLVDESEITTESYDPMKDLVNYRKPPVSLLEDYQSDSVVTDEEIYENKSKIEETLKYFGIPIQRIRATVGPTVTLYEIVQAQGVKIAKIQGLQNDIAQSLKAESGIRIIAPIPGRGTIGIEVPNRHKQVVSMYSAVRSQRFQESEAKLPVVIGRTIQNENYVFDLAKMPHLLVAGATGMGKSVGLNAIITSLLYKMHPAQLKFVMIDPKMVEFSLYAKIERQFLAKMESEDEAIVTDPRKAVYTLNSLCEEMGARLELCKKANVRNITQYNDKFTSRCLNPQHGHRFLPYIVVVIDEFADLIMTAKEVEMPVTRLAQKARAVGIHLIIATQRPSVDVITGKIKANFPARIAFRVMQMIDSRTILDRPGADQLIGRGDLLISKDGELTRVQCALVDTPEVERIVDYIAKQPGYPSAYALPDFTGDTAESGSGGEESSAPQKYDALFAEIAREAVESGQISTSMIQRNYEVGFNRAGRIMMQLERAGIVGRQQGAKPREILFHDSLSLEAKLQDLGVF